MDASLSSLPTEYNDVFSLPDQVLSDRLQFIEEIGFGNWGSVWLCAPKSSRSKSSNSLAGVPDQKIAVKLVHRSKTPTTAARIRSLWNEMKIVRTFKSDPHPSIIPFHSFIITPSYALITMPYLPTLVPVEVDELKAREWFRFLLSGIEFLHKRGVVHNDIKPANILLSPKNIPVLVDFGFAEKYNLKSETAFHSNLSYGTPEYLSPERARGLPHDTRKSDVWSLGVTFFEILIGRTPFENSDGEQFTTKEDLERYWSRTLRGKWVGEWHMSKGMERMIRRMITSNADLRCTIIQAMNDPYWDYRKEKATAPSSTSHRRSSSYSSSVVFEKDVLRLMEAARPWSAAGRSESPSSIYSRASHTQLSRVRSQSKVVTPKPTPRKRGPPIGELSPVKASPRASPFSSAAGKENIRTFNALAASTSSRSPLSQVSNRESIFISRAAPADIRKKEHDRKSRILGDLTSRHQNAENVTPQAQKKKDPVRDRVKEWERERERMREMARLELDDETSESESEEEERTADEAVERSKSAKEETRAVTPPTPSTSRTFASSFTTESSSGVVRRPSSNDSSISVLKHNIRKSIDKTRSLYKSTTSQLTGRSTPLLTVTSADDEDGSKHKSDGTKESWEDDVVLQNVPSELPSVRQAARDERVAADARMDRLTIWMRNVEKVVEDARQSFASSSTHELKTLPSLPVAPLSHSQGRTTRSNQSDRLPRKILAANEIFTNDESSNSTAPNSYTTSADTSVGHAYRNNDQSPLTELNTPSRPRRATVAIYSPEKAPQVSSDPDADPSKRREKSKSHGHLFQSHIAPLSILEEELDRSRLPAPPPSAHRLSEVLDSKLFIAPPLSPKPPSSPREEDQEYDMRNISPVQSSKSYNDLNSSPYHVKPYPTRRASMQIPPTDTPTQRRIEGVYDRFLMATSGVKRLGKGYQSDNIARESWVSQIPVYRPRLEKKVLNSARRPMSQAASNHDTQQWEPTSVDELGVISRGAVPSDSLGGHTLLKDDGKTTVALVRRAFKAMVPGKTTSRRSSRIA